MTMESSAAADRFWKMHPWLTWAEAHDIVLGIAALRWA